MSDRVARLPLPPAVRMEKPVDAAEVDGDVALVLGIMLGSHAKSDELNKTMMGFKDLFLLGFFLSVGLSGLTAWGLHRFNQLRTEVDLPSLSDPDYANRVADLSADLTAAAMAETFIAAGFVLVVAWFVAWWMRRSPHQEQPASSSTQPAAEEVPMTMNRNLIIGAAVVIVGLTAATLFLLSRVNSLSDDLVAAEERQDELEETMLRVESGAAIYAAQIEAFQEQLGSLGPTIDTALDEAVTGIETFRNSTITFDVAIDEVVPIDTEVVLDRTLDVPINTVLPIDEEFDTTITVNGGDPSTGSDSVEIIGTGSGDTFSSSMTRRRDSSTERSNITRSSTLRRQTRSSSTAGRRGSEPPRGFASPNGEPSSRRNSRRRPSTGPSTSSCATRVSGFGSGPTTACFDGTGRLSTISRWRTVSADGRRTARRESSTPAIASGSVRPEG